MNTRFERRVIIALLLMEQNVKKKHAFKSEINKNQQIREGTQRSLKQTNSLECLFLFSKFLS